MSFESPNYSTQEQNNENEADKNAQELAVEHIEQQLEEVEKECAAGKSTGRLLEAIGGTALVISLMNLGLDIALKDGMNLNRFVAFSQIFSSGFLFLLGHNKVRDAFSNLDQRRKEILKSFVTPETHD